MSKRILGLWNFGDDSFHKKLSPKEAKDLIKSAIKGGITTFDTAFSYKEADSILASSIKEMRKDISSVEIISKVMPVPTLEKKVDITLRRLNRDYIDILLLHWPSDINSVYNSLKKLEKLKERSKARAIGVSNFPLAMLKKATLDFDIEYHERPLSLIWNKEWEEEKELKLKTLSYAPLGMGLLTGRYKTKESLDDKRKELYVWNSEAFPSLISYMKSLEHREAETALSWVYRERPYGIIQGASSISDLALEPYELSKDVKAKLDEFALSITSSSLSDNIFSHNYGRV